MSSLGSNDPEFMKAKEKLLEAFRMQYGIDTPPTEAKKFLSLTEERLKELQSQERNLSQVTRTKCSKTSKDGLDHATVKYFA